MFQPGASLTFNNANTVLDAGLKAIAGGQTTIDFSLVSSVDSAAVATLLAWRRAALARATSLTFNNLPTNLQSLISLYDVTTVLDLTAARLDLPHH